MTTPAPLPKAEGAARDVEPPHFEELPPASESPQAEVAVETTKRSKRTWWLRMLLASVAMVGLLLGLVWLTPIARLHYHAWGYRQRRESKDLMWVSEALKNKGASAKICRQLLGRPDYGGFTTEGNYVIFYSPRYFTPKTGIRAGIGSVDPGARLEFHEGRLVSVRPFESNAIPDESTHGIARFLELKQDRPRSEESAK